MPTSQIETQTPTEKENEHSDIAGRLVVPEAAITTAKLKATLVSSRRGNAKPADETRNKMF